MSSAGYSSSEDDLESGSSSEEQTQRVIPTYTKDYDLHALKIDTKERAVKDVELPVWNYLPNNVFWDPKDNLPNVSVICEHIKKEGRISKEQVMALIDRIYEIFCAEDNVVYVDAPVTVCGDIHGQYYDLLKLFEVGGDPNSTTYLFLGDYVDRGNFSIECVILLFSYKLRYPKNFFLLRGNHECRHLTDYFTFKEEMEHKFDLSVYESVMDTFDALPLAAVMNNQFFCVHGGLSPDVQTVEDILKIDRFVEPPSSGPMCDLLWADPMEEFSPDIEDDFVFNNVRGCSYYYGFNAVCDFLDRNKLLSVIRAHEAQDTGYRMHRKNESTGFPSLITLFSAPNYLDSYNNKGAVLRYENNVINIRQFNNTNHPYYLPGFMNVFTWSIPFVAEKLGELLVTVCNLVDDVALEEIEAMNEEKEKRRQMLRNKVRSVSRILNMMKDMRVERENVLKLGSISPKGTDLPANLTPEKKTNIEKTLQSYEGVKSLDRPNEARPPNVERTIGDLQKFTNSPESLRRKSSKDIILSKKQQEELQNRHQKRLEERRKSTDSLPSVPSIPIIQHEKI